MDYVEHALMTALVAAMGEYHIILSGRIETNGSDGTCRHDETIYQHDKVLLGSTQHGTNGGNHLETAEVAEGC